MTDTPMNTLTKPNKRVLPMTDPPQNPKERVHPMMDTPPNPNERVSPHDGYTD